MNFGKKGDLTLRYLVLAILAVVVLIVVLIIFSGGTQEFVTKIKSILNEIWGLKPDMTKK
jgi:ABC-type lipoprotein release transport system permease subunit